MGQVDEDIIKEKDGGQIVGEQAVLHLFQSLFVLHHEKPFDVDREAQRVRVLGHHRK